MTFPKKITLLFCLFILGFMFSCGEGNENSLVNTARNPVKKPKSMLKEKSDPMKTIGIGPIKELTLPDAIDEAMAEKGKTIYKEKCTLCHKPNKKFIGPPLKGIFKKRNPAWVMNMILNPEEMVQKDPIAKQLLLEYKGSPMINQNLTQQEARAILEYLRTL